MGDLIKQLPDSVANKIAAGEVVQRPSSVVKELLENAIDAGAQNISLIIRESGKSLIRIVDDGKGMSLSDARFCFERHATSKISEAEDLFAIRTMGFRGEALASIAAVSMVELNTREKGGEIGTKVVVEGAEFKGQEPDPIDEGTSIQVKNLFYNIPARRKFLKSDPVELKHILEEFNRIALAFPNIEFSLFNGDLQVHSLKAESLQKRIVHLLGKTYQKKLLGCQEETEYLRISGFVGTPETTRKTRGEQYLFVNQRFIRSNYLAHAVKTAYQGLIPEDSFPFFVINLEIDPNHIDVNVHPSKHEVKFDDERSIYGLVNAAVKRSLGSQPLSPSIDFSKKVSLGDFNQNESDFSSSFQFGSRKELGALPPQSDAGPDRNREFEGFSSKEFFDRPQTGNPANWDEIEGGIRDLNRGYEDSNDQSSTRSMIQVAKAYIMSPIVSGVMVIDQSRAHERILYEKFAGRYEANKVNSQQCLFPEKVVLGKADIHMLMGMEKELKKVGFDFEYFGADSIVINGIPEGTSSENSKELFEGLLELFKNNSKSLNISREENLIRALAKKTSVPHGKNLEREEMGNLVDQLFACKIPQFTPEGLPTLIKMDYNYLFSAFSE